MNNNVSYRQYSVVGTASPFSFSPVGSTQRQKPAISAWTGATLVGIQPDAINDGIGTLGYKVTNPSPGLWHYEYAIYNQNMDRGIQSFSVPVGAGTSLSNIGFHAPPQQPGWTFDNTLNNAGYSSAPWNQVQANGALTWSSETLAQNPNANAIRWGTLYNFRFDSNRPPQLVSGTLGFYKTGAPITVQIMAPAPAVLNVSISGRVATDSGMGLANSLVTLTGANNFSRSFTTGTFGFFNFENVPTGSYTVTVIARRYTFSSQIIQVTDNVTGLNFITPSQ